MTSSRIKIVKHSLIYGSAELLNKGLAFLLIPLYSRTFDRAEYGILQLLVITGTLISIVSQLGLSSALFRTVLNHEKTEHAGIYASATRFLTLISLFTAFILFILVPQWGNFLTGGLVSSRVLYYLIGAALFKNLTIVPNAKLRIEEKPVLFSLYNSSRYATQLGLILIAVLFLKKGIWGVIWADLAVSILWGILGLWILRSELQAATDKKSLKEMLHFGLPLVPAALALYLLNMADRYLLKILTSAESVGLYSMGYRIGMIMVIAVGAFQQSWAATMFRVAKGPNPEEEFPKLYNHFSAVLLLIGLGISLFSNEILYVFSTPLYFNASTLIPWVAGGYYFLGLYYFTAIGIHLKKKTQWQPLIVGIAAILNVGLNFCLIPVWGGHGAAVATFISFLVMGVLATLTSQHYYPLPYQWGKNGLLFFIAVALIVLKTYLMHDNTWTTICIKCGLLFSFAALTIKIYHGSIKHLSKFKRLNQK